MAVEFDGVPDNSTRPNEGFIADEPKGRELYTLDQRAMPFRPQEAPKVDPHLKVRLLQQYPDLSEKVIDRAASNTRGYAPIIIEKYRLIAEQVNKLSSDEKNRDMPPDVLIEAASKGEEPKHILAFREFLARNSERQKGMQRNGSFIDGVPLIKQRHVNWCGYSSLAMVSQYNGYTDLTPERLFRHEFGDYDAILEHIAPNQGPSIDTLALMVQELTPLTPRILGTKEHSALQVRNPAFATPQDVLKTFLEKKVPSIIRVPSHFVVVTGFDPESNEYTYNDPARGLERTMPAEDLESVWGAKEYYPRDARNLMMVLTKPRKSV